MRLSSLKKKYPKSTIYIVGTGPSLRVFPKAYIKDKITIGLNQAWKHLNCKYSITVHPELVDEFNEEAGPINKTQWVVKQKGSFVNVSLDNPKYYMFKTVDRDFSIFTKPVEDHLFIGRGVQQTAMNLAALMGASTIILVGVDMAAVGGDHHGHDQHVRFHGLPPDQCYSEYREYTAKARVELTKMGISVLTLSPFLGADSANEDYTRLCKEKGLAKLPPPEDTSPYKREGSDLPPGKDL